MIYLYLIIAVGCVSAVILGNALWQIANDARAEEVDARQRTGRGR